MIAKRGEVWLADLEPTRGSEQAGTRPVIIFQNDMISRFSTTVLTIPLTSNLRRASLPTCLLISSGDGGLSQSSVALCYQGQLQPETIEQLEGKVLFTLGY
jgi:mRNA interferase MazF